MTTQTTKDLLEQLAAHQRRLAVLLRQVATLGSAYATPGQLEGIEEARTAIAELIAVLRARGVEVDETPSVQLPSPSQAATTGAHIGQAEIAGIVSLPGANFAGAQGLQITGVQIGERKPRPEPPKSPLPQPSDDTAS